MPICNINRQYSFNGTKHNYLCLNGVMFLLKVHSEAGDSVTVAAYLTMFDLQIDKKKKILTVRSTCKIDILRFF